MTAWVHRFSVVLLDATMAATLLSCVVVLLMVGCRQPARRIWLARSALIGLLAVLPLSALTPLPRLELVRLLDGTNLGAHPLLTSSRALFNASQGAHGDPINGSPSRTLGSIATLGTVMRKPSDGIVVAYLSGLGIGLGWLSFGYWGLGWLTKRSWEPSASTMEAYSRLAFEGPRHRPRLRVAARVQRPVLLGLFRQTILVPVELDLPESVEKLRLSLLHELAHSERRDPWFSLASGLAQAFWFFVPPVWWIRSQMRLDQEFLADRRAAIGFGPLKNYASSLLELAGTSAGGSGSPARMKGNPGGLRSALFLRVLMLVQCPFPVESHPPRWWSWTWPILILLATLAASSLSLRSSMAGLERPLAASGPVPGRTFRVARLLLNPDAPGIHGRAPLFELPLRLPERFRLDVEVWGDLDALRRTRVVGHRLTLPAPSVRPQMIVEEWHRVQVLREPLGLSIRIDDRPIPIDPNAGTTTWLSVEPSPNLAAQFRNLILTW